MKVWWEEYKLEKIIDVCSDRSETKIDSHNYDPRTFLLHLKEKIDENIHRRFYDDNYLHLGVDTYVRDLYKDYNEFGHHALFKVEKRKKLKPYENGKRYDNRLKQALQPNPPQSFDVALDHERNVSESEDKRLKETMNCFKVGYQGDP